MPGRGRDRGKGGDGWVEWTSASAGGGPDGTPFVDNGTDRVKVLSGTANISIMGSRVI